MAARSAVFFACMLGIVWVAPPYYQGLLTLVGIYALVALGLNLFMGYAGQVSLGQAAFVALGAYTSAGLAVKAHVSPWLGLPAAACVAGGAAYAAGFFALRLREHHLALATLALGIIVAAAFNEWEYLGGSSGLKDIPGFTLGTWTFDVRAYGLLTWTLLAFGMCFAANLVASNYGRALVAVADGELAAAALGISPERMKRQAFVVSGMYAGTAGALYASYISYIDATSFGVLLSVNFVLMCVIGGLRSLWGAVIGAGFVVALGQVLQSVVPVLVPSARGDFQSFFFGAILIAMLIALPQGLVTRFGRPQRT